MSEPNRDVFRSSLNNINDMKNNEIDLWMTDVDIETSLKRGFKSL